MSVVTATDRRQIVSTAFDEACDAVAAGEPERAEYILDRALPKPQARHVLECILTHNGNATRDAFGLIS